MPTTKYVDRKGLLEKWKSETNEEKIKHALPKLKTSAKSVQTTAEVSRKVHANIKMSTTYLLKCLRVLIIVSACTYDNEYDVLTTEIRLSETIA